MTHRAAPATTVVFDLGGVLVDWAPRRVLSRLLPEPGAVERFLAEVATPQWHDRQDRGRPVADGIAELSRAHPDSAALIAAFYDQWDDMFAGELPASVAVLRELQRAGTRLLALTNWPYELFDRARRRFPVLAAFEAIVVSGDPACDAVGLAKPDPAVFALLVDRHGVDPADAVYLDDSEQHVAAATALGFDALRFTTVTELRQALASRGLPVADDVTVRPGSRADVEPLTELYNGYVTGGAVTFDLEPWTVGQRHAWFDEHPATGRHRLLVATVGDEVVGYATSGTFRSKAAYLPSVETSVYLRPGAGGRGVGSMLYQELFRVLAGEDAHMAFAAVTLPNPASQALHARFGFSPIGSFREVGRKAGAWHDVGWSQRPV